MVRNPHNIKSRETEKHSCCTQGTKEVAKANLAMHEAHCQRFLCVCPDCDESVAKDQLDDHRVEQHTLVKCKKCNMNMEQQKLGDHETNECPERLRSCEFCELDLPVNSMKEHTVACGSRTELCPDCNQYVMLKDQLHHAQICSSALAEKHYSKSQSLLPFLSSFVLCVCGPSPLSHQRCDLHTNPSRDPKSDQRSPSDLNLSFSVLEKTKKNVATGWADIDQISTCSQCHLALPLRTLQWHESKCKIFESLKLMKPQK
uniref:TRAF-type domain-containing protein n=1 Tax=Electrophorus electricus TaxID=8005 RepID=A0A4W4H328_ELEEL